jgi:membrane fusion protein, multidrug efflux system
MASMLISPPRGLLMVLMAAAGVAQAQTPVSVVLPSVGESVETLRFTGSLSSREAAQLSTRVAGLVASLGVDVGDVVMAGQPLLQLDARLAELELASHEAARDEARAALEEARRLAEEGQRLVGDRFLPDTLVRAREAAVVAAEAALARAEAELGGARERLTHHTLRAPFGGVIARRLAARGEWITPGMAVLELVRVDELWLDVQVPQRHWAALGAAEPPVRAFADVDPQRPLAAGIHARVPVSDPTARTFLLRLRIQDDTGSITPGMSAQVELDLLRDERATRVPRDALLRYPDGTTTVWLVAAGSSEVRQRSVTVRRILGEEAELAEALPAGARVVVRGNEVLSEGQVVRILEDAR